MGKTIEEVRACLQRAEAAFAAYEGRDRLKERRLAISAAVWRARLRQMERQGQRLVPAW